MLQGPEPRDPGGCFSVFWQSMEVKPQFHKTLTYLE